MLKTNTMAEGQSFYSRDEETEGTRVAEVTKPAVSTEEGHDWSSHVTEHPMPLKELGPSSYVMWTVSTGVCARALESKGRSVC